MGQLLRALQLCGGNGLNLDSGTGGLSIDGRRGIAVQRRMKRKVQALGMREVDRRPVVEVEVYIRTHRNMWGARYIGKGNHKRSLGLHSTSFYLTRPLYTSQ